jgi:sugar lactone lactonase YvrE
MAEETDVETSIRDNLAHESSLSRSARLPPGADVSVRRVGYDRPDKHEAKETPHMSAFPPYLRVLPAIALAAGLPGCAGNQNSPGGFVPAAPAQPSHVGTPNDARDGAAVPDASVRIFTANRDGGSVLAFKVKSTGDVSPQTTIAGSKTQLSDPDSLAVDTLGDIYTADDGASQVEVFAPGANGNVKPKRTIAGSKTGLGPTEGMTVDTSGDLWVSNFSGNAITEYAPGAKGNVAPVATISGTSTELETPVGMATDGQGRLYVANIGSASIVAFAKGVEGNVAPIVSISGSDTKLSRPFALAFDGTGRLLVADENSGVLVFAKGAAGDATPVAQITGLNDAAGVTADAKNHIWAAEFSGNAIKEFRASANGNAAPIRTIQGPNTTLNGANYLALH